MVPVPELEPLIIREPLLVASDSMVMVAPGCISRFRQSAVIFSFTTGILRPVGDDGIITLVAGEGIVPQSQLSALPQSGVKPFH